MKLIYWNMRQGLNFEPASYCLKKKTKNECKDLKFEPTTKLVWAEKFFS